MSCSECRYYRLDTDEYPCSECKYGDMFVKDDGQPISQDMLILIREVRQLKEAIKNLTEVIEKNEQ